MRPKRRNFATSPVKLVVLVVGVSEPFLERFRTAAAPRKAEIIAADEATFRAVAAHRIPRTIVVSSDLYSRARTTFDTVTSDLCARIVEVPTEELAETDVDALVDRAVRWA